TELYHTHRQQRHQSHARQADVEGPERGRQHALVPLLVRLQSAQTEQHEPDAEQAVYTEQRGMAVQWREIETLHVVERQRRVDEKTEQPGADQVPERDRREEQDRPTIALHPRRGLPELERLIRLKPDERERHDLERREARTQRDHGCRRSA